MIQKRYHLKRWNSVINHIFIYLLIPASTFAQKKLVDQLSFQSLNIEIFSSAFRIGSATGFIVEKNHKDYLITNLHVVTGIDYFSHATIDPQQKTPTILGIWHNAQVLGSWTKSFEELFDENNKKRWIECEFEGKTIDLIALPLKRLNDKIKIYPVDLKTFDDSITVMPGFSVSIIGFPYGQSAGEQVKFAIWKTGHIASDYDIDINGMPMFLIDATTRPGMSGSIVVFRTDMYRKNETTVLGAGTRFLGVFTAQSNQEEIGYVIKPSAFKALIDKLP